MNWHMIISGLIVVVLKIVGMTFFYSICHRYLAKVIAASLPRGAMEQSRRCSGGVLSALVPQAAMVQVKYIGPSDCTRGWDFHQGRCFFLSTSELSFNQSRNFCIEEGSTLAIVNTPEKLKFLQNIAGAEKYFIGLTYQSAEKQWRWINNSVFNGNVTNLGKPFNCATIGLTNTFDAASCDVNYRWICEKNAK